MKKAVLYLFGWIFVVFCVVGCGSDDDDSAKKPAVVEVTSVQLSQSKLTLHTGDTITLTATVSPANATNKNVTWKSSNISVATVSSSGVVKALKEGETTITATAGGKSATCQVSVKPNVVAVTSVTLSASELSLKVGDSQTLTATVSPSNATDKTVTWKSSNTSAATVSSSGVVKATKEGETTITATAGGKSATCQVTVKSNVVAVTSVTLSASKLSLKVGESQTLSATVSPSNATDKTVTWKSSNTSAATVSSSGEVKASGAGNTVITATAGGKSASCQVTVKQEGGGVDASIDPWDESEEYHGTVN